MTAYNAHNIVQKGLANLRKKKQKKAKPLTKKQKEALMKKLKARLKARRQWPGKKL